MRPPRRRQLRSPYSNFAVLVLVPSEKLVLVPVPVYCAATAAAAGHGYFAFGVAEAMEHRLAARKLKAIIARIANKTGPRAAR